MVNYDLPVRHESPTEPDHEVYLHRIGRAGRFGRKGNLLSLSYACFLDILIAENEPHINVMNFTQHFPLVLSRCDIQLAVQ